MRNFGFITVTGQDRQTMWARARRTREVWAEVASAAGIPVLQEGLWMLASRPESVDVLNAFLATEMAVGSLSAAECTRSARGDIHADRVPPPALELARK